MLFDDGLPDIEASGSPHQLCRVGGAGGAGGENNFFLRLTPHNSLGGVLVQNEKLLVLMLD